MSPDGGDTPEPTGAELDAEALGRLLALSSAIAKPRLRRRPSATPVDRFARRPARTTER